MKKANTLLKNGMEINQLEDRYEMGSATDSSGTVWTWEYYEHGGGN